MKLLMEKKRPLLDRIVPSVIVIFLMAIVLSSVTELPKKLISIDENLYTILQVAVLTVLLEFVFRKLVFKGKYEGSIKLERTREGLLLLIPVIILDIVCFVIDRIVGAGSPMNSLFYVLAVSLTAGVIEELLFRAYSIPNVMRIDRTYKGMMVGVVASSILFGLSHLMNLSSGANLGRTISQAFTAGISGVLFSAVFLNCGTILPVMLMHFFHDVINLLFMAITDGGGMAEGFTVIGTIEQVVFSAVELGLGIWYLRPARFRAIRKLWDKKWSDTSLK